MRGIVAFEIPIDRLEGKAKLSQNRSAADRARVRAALAAEDDPLARAVADGGAGPALALSGAGKSRLTRRAFILTPTYRGPTAAKCTSTRSWRPASPPWSSTTAWRPTSSSRRTPPTSSGAPRPRRPSRPRR